MSSIIKDLDLKELDGSDLSFSFINDLQNDPALYLLSKKTGTSYLFDVGDISSLANKNLVKIKYLFISHTHMDHFIGFTSLVRINVPLMKSLTVIGPKNIHLHIKNALSSFEWNLITKDQLRFSVYEILENTVNVYDITNTNGFDPKLVKKPIPSFKTFYTPLPSKPSNFVLSLDNGAGIYAVILDHGIDSIAYMYQSPIQFKVSKEALKDMNLTPGVWISELEEKIKNNKLNDSININTADGIKKFKVDFLYKELISIKESRTFSYLTDFYFTPSNIQRIKLLCQDSETMFCESSFMDIDYKKAFYKKHLTTKQLALLAAYCNVANIQCFHISRSYKNYQDITYEVREFFKQFSILDQDSIKLKIQEELDRISKIN